MLLTPALTSLRAQLLRWLILPLAAVFAAGALAAYFTALRLTTDAYDKALLDPALAIAERLRIEPAESDHASSPPALEVMRIDADDEMFYAVWRAGTLVAGAADLPRPASSPRPGLPLVYDGLVAGRPVRVVAVAVGSPSGPVLVQVAETVERRRAMVGQVLLATAVPEALFALTAAVLVWIGVGRALKPLDALRAELAARSHRDLRALPETFAPAEVRPLVTGLNDLLARLSTAMDAQSRFIADAAHQLRTPLAALQAQVEAARREPHPAALDPTLDQLEAATRRTAHLARQLLTLARVEPTGDSPLESRPIDLAVLVRERIDAWLAAADSRHVDLGFELEPAPSAGDPLLVLEMAGNLVDNAIKYSPPRSYVTVRTGSAADGSWFEVQDEGVGIPPAERDRVFERFYRVRGTRGEGSGLGLAIVREIAHRHGASVTIRSPHERQGTVFRVTFPRPDSTTDARSAVGSTGPEDSTSSVRRG